MNGNHSPPQPDHSSPSKVAKINRQMAAGAGWMVAMQFAIRSIAVVSTIILARLLVPEDFGLVALATMMLAVLDVMGGFSFDLALIREQNAKRGHYDTVWTLAIARGVVIAAILVVLAVPAAVFFEDPRLEAVVYWLALAAFIEGFENVGVVDFRKKMEFAREARFRFLLKLGGFFVTFALAVIWRDYWALIAGIVAGRALQVALSYFLHHFRPRIALTRWREIMHFSKWVMVNNLVIFIGNRADTLIIGKLIGPHVLGLYNVAYEISNMPTTELVWPIQRAIFPGYAKIAGDLEALKRGYLTVLSLALMVAVPMGLGIGLTAEPLVWVFLGEKWIEAIPLLEVLAIFGVIRVGFANGGSVLLALGKTMTMTALTATGLVIRLPLLVWGALEAGALGAAWGLTASAVFGLLLNTGAVLVLLRLPLWTLAREVWRTLLAAVVMVVAVSLVSDIWPASESIGSMAVHLLELVAAGAVSYIGVLVLTWWLSGRPEGAEQHILVALRGGIAKIRKPLVWWN